MITKITTCPFCQSVLEDNLQQREDFISNPNNPISMARYGLSSIPATYHAWCMNDDCDSLFFARLINPAAFRNLRDGANSFYYLSKRTEFYIVFLWAYEDFKAVVYSNDLTLPPPQILDDRGHKILAEFKCSRDRFLQLNDEDLHREVEQSDIVDEENSFIGTNGWCV